jgi:hypothetical protein
MSGFGRTSAPVAICGVLRFLEALDSYKFDYSGVGWTPPLRHFFQLHNDCAPMWHPEVITVEVLQVADDNTRETRNQSPAGQGRSIR